MKTFIWKIRYALEIRHLLKLSLIMSWQMAGSAVESIGDDIDICSPKQAAEDERDEWLACC
jgi:hypothetical protein